MIEYNNILDDEARLLELEEQINKLINENQNSPLIEILNLLSPTDTALIIERLSNNKKEKVITLCDYFIIEKIIPYISYETLSDIYEVKGFRVLAKIIHNKQNDDLTYQIVSSLNDDQAENLLHSLSLYNQRAVASKLSYAKDSAGRIMSNKYNVIRSHWTVSQSIKYIENIKKNLKNTPDTSINEIYVVNKDGETVGLITLFSLLNTNPESEIVNHMNTNFKSTHYSTDQEEVALLFKNNDISSICVTDDKNNLIGIINIKSIINVIYTETEEDLLLISGVSVSKYKTIIQTSKNRLKWLSVNLIEAATIPFIVAYFSDILSKYVIIAALIQFVVALSGNAGMQSLSITLRSITLKMISKSNKWNLISKEITVGFTNACIIGLIGLAWGYAWGEHEIRIAIVAFLAVWINLILGTIFGTFYPLLFKKLNVDPAVASSICVTTSNDIFGFLIVLYISSLILPV